MGSKITCKCGRTIITNMFSGTDISAVVTEEFLETDRAGATADDLADRLILESERLLRCKPCGRIVLMKRSRGADTIRFFKPDDD